MKTREALTVLAAHRGDNQERASDDIDRIPLPQLFELLTADVLVDFVK